MRSRLSPEYKMFSKIQAINVLSMIAFLCFQLFPRQIISVFGSGSEMYFQFSERYFRIYMFLTLINGIQPVTANFFSSIGKAQLGVKFFFPPYAAKAE